MSKVKKVSAKEKIEIYEAFFARLHFNRHIAMSESRVAAMLEIADKVTEAKDEDERNLALDRMRTLP